MFHLTTHNKYIFQGAKTTEAAEDSETTDISDP